MGIIWNSKIKITDKKLIKAIEGVFDPAVKKVLEGTGDTLCAFKFFREHEPAFRALMPKYFDDMLDDFNDTYSSYSYIPRKNLLLYLCLETGIVDPCDIASIKNFSVTGAEAVDLHGHAPRSTVFKRGLEKGSFSPSAVLRIAEENPDYLLYLLPLLTSVDSAEFYDAIRKYLENARLQDTLRYHLLHAMLRSRNAVTLAKYTDMIESNNYYRLRAINEVAVSIGDYDKVLPAKQLVPVLRDAATDKTEKYMNADFKHAWHFINAYDRLYDLNKFKAFAFELLERGGERARWALLCSLKADVINGGFAEKIFAQNLTLDDFSFFGYEINGEVIQEKLLPIVFERLFDIMSKMDKVSYHYKTDDDITFARDVSKSRVVGILAQIAARSDDITYTERLDALFDSWREEAQAAYLELNGKKTKLDVRAQAIKFLKTDNYRARKFYESQKIKLTYDEAVEISDYLKTKKHSVKSEIVKAFLRSKDKTRIAEYLSGCDEDYKKQVGEELSGSMDKVSEERLDKPASMFGWSKKSVFEVKMPKAEMEKIAAQKFDRKKLKPIKFSRLKEFVDELAAFRASNSDYEYDTNYGDGKVTLGAKFVTLKHDEPMNHVEFKNYPLGDGFKNIYAKLTQDELTFVLILVHCLHAENEKLFTAIYGGDAKKCYELLNSMDRSYFSQSTFRLVSELHVPATYELAELDTLRDIVCAFADKSILPYIRKAKDDYFRHRCQPDLFMRVLCEKDDSVETLRLLLRADCMFMLEGLSDDSEFDRIAAAYEKGIISDELTRYLIYKQEYFGGVFDGDHKGNVMRPMYPHKKFRDFLLAFVDEALSAEFNRGVLQTPYSEMLAHCRKLFGVKYYVTAIAALRGLTWVRSPYGYEKNDVFSAVLKMSVKAERDNYDEFARLIALHRITDEELIRATLFNPEFVDWTAQYLKIPGLKTAVFWFVAHLNETLYGENKDRREQQIKEFSDISYPDFQDGAFDYNWYNEMIAAVPERELKRIYQNAKYVTVGGLHKRAQRFFDAVNGRIDKAECLEKINGTRNKDYCLIYSLIPVKDKADLYERYAVLGEFVRTSKQFGAQRQASERRTVDIAFENLARAAGYADTDIFIFEMESETPSDVYKPYVADDITVIPYIDERAFKVAYSVNKAGKLLQSIPQKAAKDKTIASLRDEIKALNKKFRRIISGMENAMCVRTLFTPEQISSMCRERIIATVLEKLFLLADGTLAFVKDGKIVDLSGNALAVKNVCVAHPVELSKKGLLQTAIDYVVKNNLKQPFKQALREIYVKADDELEFDEVLRFRGFSVDLKKCVAALKSRGWSVSEDIGLRKVYYKTDTVAAIFREFDCLYTVDYENVNRELHGVFFIKRKSGEIIPLKDVDDITFSETLRDVDLMITISSNVTYDFELAKSTVEIRREILQSIVRILSLDNVSFLKENIKVEGYYGTYVINIRTGLVFKEGKGNLLLDTVYSVDKPLLLDFIDEDPLSADIISKAVVLSDDKRITDPKILFQIKDN